MKGTRREVRVYCKGAPDFFLMDADPSSGISYPEMKFVQTEKGESRLEDTALVPENLQTDGGPKKDTQINIYKRTVKYFAQRAFRTILVTYRDMSMDEFENLKRDNNNFEKPEDRDCLEKELVAVGIFGLQDPLRKGIRESVKTCNDAKIRVIMCTGDNIDTAVAISKDAGIVTEEECTKYGGTVESGNYSCMTGKQFRELVGELIVDANGVETPKHMKKFRDVKK